MASENTSPNLETEAELPVPTHVELDEGEREGESESKSDSGSAEPVDFWTLVREPFDDEEDPECLFMPKFHHYKLSGEIQDEASCDRWMAFFENIYWNTDKRFIMYFDLSSFTSPSWTFWMKMVIQSKVSVFTWTLKANAKKLSTAMGCLIH